MRGTPGVPALGHLGLDPARCRTCLAGAPPAPPPTPPRPARVRRVVPLPAVDVTAPTPHVEMLERRMPGFADAVDEYADRFQGVGAYAPPASPEPEPEPELPAVPAPEPPAPKVRRRRLAPGELSVPRIILVAAWTHTRRHGPSLMFGDIVVAAWQRDRTRLSLHAYDLPDSHRVLAKICGKHGLIRQGLLERTAPGLYRLTPRGAREAARLARLVRGA